MTRHLGTLVSAIFFSQMNFNIRSFLMKDPFLHLKDMKLAHIIPQALFKPVFKTGPNIFDISIVDLPEGF